MTARISRGGSTPSIPAPSRTKPEPNFGHRLAVADLTTATGRPRSLSARTGARSFVPSASSRRLAMSGCSTATTGTLLYQLNGTTDGGQFGIAIATGDVDGDGHPDVIVGERWGSPEAVHVYDGLTGAELCVYTNPGPGGLVRSDGRRGGCGWQRHRRMWR